MTIGPQLQKLSLTRQCFFLIKTINTHSLLINAYTAVNYWLKTGVSTFPQEHYILSRTVHDLSDESHYSHELRTSYIRHRNVHHNAARHFNYRVPFWLKRGQPLQHRTTRPITSQHNTTQHNATQQCHEHGPPTQRGVLIVPHQRHHELRSGPIESMSGHLNPDRIRIGRRRVHPGRREPIWIGSVRHGFEIDPIWIELSRHGLEWEPKWIGSVRHGFEMNPIWIGLPRMSSIENRNGSGRSDIASDMGWTVPIWSRVRADMDRVGPLWIRHRPDMDWLGRHGFRCEQLWVGAV